MKMRVKVTDAFSDYTADNYDTQGNTANGSAWITELASTTINNPLFCNV